MKGLNTITMYYLYPRDWTRKPDPRLEKNIWIQQEREMSLLIAQESSFICTPMESILRKLKIFPCSRLNIFWTDEVSPDSYSYEKDKNGWKTKISLCDSICEVYIEFDTSYISFSEKQKVEYIMEILDASLRRLCRYYSVDENPVRDALASVRNALESQKKLGPYSIRNYKNLRYDGMGAQLICYHSMYRLYFAVLLSSSVIGKVEIPFFETSSDRASTIAPLGKFYWLDEKTLCLEASNKGNPFASPEEIGSDQLLDVTEYRIAHASAKQKR